MENQRSPALPNKGKEPINKGTEKGVGSKPVLFLDVVGRYFDENFLRTGNMALSAAIKAAGFDTTLLTVKEDDDPEWTVKAVEQIRPRIIMVSLFSILFVATSKVLQKLRKKPDTLVIAGGHHATSDPENTLRLDGVDLVCVGEGDLVIPRLLEHLSKYKDRKSFLNALPSISDLPGIRYMDEDGKAIDTGPAPRAADLDSLQLWDRDLYPSPFIEDNSLLKMGRIMPVYSGRGCPYSCSYCANSGLQNLYGKEGHVRQRSVENLVQELAHLKHERKAEIFFFCDEQFLLSRSWARKFASLYKKEVNLPYVIMTSPQTIDEESSKILRESGCSYVNMGLESGHEDYRRTMLGKKFSNRLFLDAVKWLKKSGLKVCINIMIRLPEETLEHALATLDVLARAEADQVEVCIYNPFPSTRLADLARKKGLLEEVRWRELVEESKHQQTIKERRILRIGEDRFQRIRVSKMTEKEYRWYSNAVEAYFWNVDMRFAWNHHSPPELVPKKNKKVLWVGRNSESRRILEYINELEIHSFDQAPENKSIVANPNVMSLFFHELNRLNPAAVYLNNPDDTLFLSGTITSGGRLFFTPYAALTHHSGSPEFLSLIGIMDPNLFSGELLTWISHTMRFQQVERDEGETRDDMKKTKKSGAESRPEIFSEVEIRSAGRNSFLIGALITSHLSRVLHKSTGFKISQTSHGCVLEVETSERGSIRWICIMDDGPGRIMAWTRTLNVRKRFSAEEVTENSTAADREALWSRGPHHEIVLAKHGNKIRRMEKQGPASHKLAASAMSDFVRRGEIKYIDGNDMALANTYLAELEHLDTQRENPCRVSQRSWRWPSGFLEHVGAETLVDMDPITNDEIVFIHSLHDEQPQLLRATTGDIMVLPNHPSFSKWEREGGPFYKAFAEENSFLPGQGLEREIMEPAQVFLNAWKTLSKKES